MTRIAFKGLAVAGAVGLAAAMSAAFAQNAPAQTPAQKAAPAEAPIYGSQLMTPSERAEMRQKMQAAKTAEERTQLRNENHAKMVQRANESGVTLAGPRGDPRLYGQQLMTPEERNAQMEKMRAATTREERIKLRDEHRAEMQKRAQEKGITLPEPRMGMGPGMGAGKGGMGPGMGGGMGMRGGGPGPNPPATTPSGPAAPPSK